MSADDPDEDRTVIRPPGTNGPTRAPAPTADAGFQKTEWSAANAIPRTAPAPPPQQDIAGHLPVGTRLGEFEITSLIGEGGFGIVYLANDHSLQRRVALKEYMPSSLAQRVGGLGASQVQVKSERHRETFEAGMKSFINEARLLASFDHPALVKVYRFWEANGTAYMVMPFLEGTTLKDVLRNLPDKPDEAWLRGVLGPLTEALQVIHAEQCYHRDIAPDNVMLLPGSNRWLLLDFGAARRVIGDMTQALTVILKPGYAPVEQYAEVPGMKQGPWTDVYALAAVVYFAIMGRTPPPSVGRLLNDTYAPLATAAAGRYSPAFLSAIDRALAVRPEERTQSIGELRHDLGLGAGVVDNYTTRPLAPHEVPQRTAAVPAPAPTVPRGTPAAATPPAAPAPAPAPAQRSNALVGIGIGVVALGAVGFGAYALLAPKPRPVAAPAPAPIVAATPAPAPPPVVAAPVPAPSPPPATFDIARELDRVVQGQTPGFTVLADSPKSTVRIGHDEFKFKVTSEREGFLYVIGYSADGSVTFLVPNSRSGTVKLRKGQAWSFPTGDGVYLPVDEPAGVSKMLVMVSARQRSHELLNLKYENLMRQFPTADAMGRIAAANPGAGSLIAGKPLCPANTNPCDDEYGAAIVGFDAVR